MVREMTAKHLAAINRGRKDAGLKAIRFKKERKALLAKQSKQAKPVGTSTDIKKPAP